MPSRWRSQWKTPASACRRRSSAIFEAFQQGDAGTSRKYGGTGLGLATGRELAVLLGSEIRLASVHGQAASSRCTCRCAMPARARCAPPATATDPLETRSEMTVLPIAREEHIPDDRNSLEGGDEVLLIVEDDPHYARILLGLARDIGFKGIVATKGAQALALARQYEPAAISLDIFLPDMLGWTVLNQLKLDPATRHIPVQIVTLEEERQHGLARGAFAYLVKEPTTTGLEAAFGRIKEYTAAHTKRLLVVEDDDIERASIVELLDDRDIETVAVGSGKEALAAMRGQAFDCVVLDLRLPDMSGFDLLERVHAEPS
jgi:CheY-like chemotaxis protein